MKLEHVGYNVPDPAAMADWWVANLGFEVVFRGDDEAECRFIRDDSGMMCLELYRNKSLPMPDYRAADPGLMHVALWSEDTVTDAKRLVEAGATMVSEAHTPGLDIAILRDPWGFPVQFAHRTKPMLKN